MTGRRLAPLAILAALAACGSVRADNPALAETPVAAAHAFPLLVLDETFARPRFRAGTTYDGLMRSRGLWSAPGVWWSDQPWTQGYGFDLYPRLDTAPADIYTIGGAGLRLRSRRFTDAELARLPLDRRTVTRVNNDGLRVTQRPWIGAHLTTFYALRVTPPFALEVEATLPATTGGRIAWPAIWLYTTARRPGAEQGREAEIDIHEGFGPDGAKVLRFGMLDWPYGQDKTKVGPIETKVSLAGRHRYGIEVGTGGVRRTLDGVPLGETAWPKDMAWNQPWAVYLDLSAGIPWNWPDAAGRMRPFLYPAPAAPPSDFLVHRVIWRAQSPKQVWRNGV